MQPELRPFYGLFKFEGQRVVDGRIFCGEEHYVGLACTWRRWRLPRRRETKRSDGVPFQPPLTPWAEPGSRFTLHFEYFAVQVILASRSLTQAAELLELDWDSVQRIVDRAVARGLLRRTTDGVAQAAERAESDG